MKKLCIVLAGLALSLALTSCASTDLRSVTFASPETIAEWVEYGVRTSENDRYAATSKQTDKWFKKGVKLSGYGIPYSTFEASYEFYKVVMADRTAFGALVSYGACLTNLRNFEDALLIYDLVLRTENSHHELALHNIDMTWQYMAALEEGRMEEFAERLAQQQQQQDNYLDDFLASMNALSSSLAQAGQQSSVQSSQAAPSNTPTVNTAGYQSAYDRFRRQVESNLSSLRKLIEVNSRGSPSYNGLLVTLRANQRDMRRIRQEAARNSVIIVQSPLEDRDP
jgi:hypothetical protein